MQRLHLHDQIISNIINTIWEDYDKDGRGTLDIAECRDFMKDILKNLG